jgi:hypothetical protein
MMQQSIILGITGLVFVIIAIILFTNNKEKLSNEVIIEAPVIETVVLESPTIATTVAKVNRITYRNHQNQMMVKITVQAGLFVVDKEKYKVVFSNEDSNTLGNNRSFDMVHNAGRFELIYEEPFENSNLMSFSNVKIMFRSSIIMSGKF